jgi:hypothetical protein
MGAVLDTLHTWVGSKGLTTQEPFNLSNSRSLKNFSSIIFLSACRGPQRLRNLRKRDQLVRIVFLRRHGNATLINFVFFGDHAQVHAKLAVE